MEPFPYQRADLNTLRAHGYVGLLNVCTGAGKTVVSVHAIKESGAKRVLIIAPSGTMETAWKKTVRKILGVEAREIGNTGKDKKAAMFDWEMGYDGVFLSTPQMFTRAESEHWSGDMLIGDEAHTYSTPLTKGQRKLSGGTPKEGERSLVRRFPMRILLSGTALRNRFELAWSHGRSLWFYDDRREGLGYSNYWNWQNDRMASRQVYTNQRDQYGNPKKVTEFYGEKHPGRWVSEAPCIITHLKRERCCEFHPNGVLPNDAPTVRNETIPLLPAQKKAVKDLEDTMMTYLESHPMVVDIPLTKATRIRQFTLGVPSLSFDEDGEIEEVYFDEDCKSPYLDRLVDLVTDEFEDENVVVYTSSRKFAEVTVKRLQKAGVTAFEYSGATKKTRDSNLVKFGDSFRVIVAVLAAVAEGVDTLQHKSKTEIWLDRSTDETLNEQAMGRLDRQGGIGQVERVMFNDDLGLSENRYSAAISRRLELNRSLRKAG